MDEVLQVQKISVTSGAILVEVLVLCHQVSPFQKGHIWQLCKEKSLFILLLVLLGHRDLSPTSENAIKHSGSHFIFLN